MQTISHRELRNDSSRILREVASGESFEITNHGEVVARITPVGGGYPGLPVARAALRPYDFDELPWIELTESTQDILDDLRSERL